MIVVKMTMCTASALVFLLATTFSHPGVGIVMDKRGNVFYTDLKHVWKIAPDGKTSIAVHNVHTHELCLDTLDNLYGEHLWYEGDATKKWGHRVWRLSGDGKLEDIVPASEGFLKNYSFARDRNGAMYWAERGVPTMLYERSTDGKISTYGPKDFFKDVRWFTATADGTLFLSEGNSICKVTPDGKVTTLAKNLIDRSISQIHVSDKHALMGLWTDKSGNVYVAVYAGRVVKRISPDGKVNVVAKSSFPWSPTGGLVAPNGDKWLLECSMTNAVRVRRIAVNGREHIY